MDLCSCVKFSNAPVVHQSNSIELFFERVYLNTLRKMSPATFFFTIYTDIHCHDVRHDAKIVTFLVVSVTFQYCFWRSPKRHGVTKDVTVYYLWLYYYMYSVLVHILRVPTLKESSTTSHWHANTQRSIFRAKERRQGSTPAIIDGVDLIIHIDTEWKMQSFAACGILL